MKHVIDVDKDTVIELRLPPAAGAVDEQPHRLLLRPLPLEPDAAGDTAGFVQDAGDATPGPIIPLSLAGLKRLVVVCDPRPGPPPQVMGQDVQGFRWMEEQDKPDGPGSGYPAGGYGGGGSFGAGLATGIAIAIFLL